MSKILIVEGSWFNTYDIKLTTACIVFLRQIELEKRKAFPPCAYSSLSWYLFTAGCDVLDDDASCSSSSCVGQRLREQHTTQA